MQVTMLQMMQRMKREMLQWQMRAQSAQQQNAALMQRVLDKQVCCPCLLYPSSEPHPASVCRMSSIQPSSWCSDNRTGKYVATPSFSPYLFGRCTSTKLTEHGPQ